MNVYVKSLLCTAALFMLASGWALASDAQWIAPDGEFEILPEASDTCGAEQPCGGTHLSVFVPKLTPGLQFSAGLLYLKPGADNLGWSTVTTYYPIQNPQWSVESLSPKFQPGFGVGARYVIPNSGKDIQTNWDHLRTGDSQYVAVSDLSTQWISPFSQTGPSTSELVNQTGIFYFKAAAAKVGFDYDQVNLDAGQSVNIGPNSQFRLFAGLSFVRLREQLISTFYNDTSVSPIPPATAVPDPSLRYISLNNTSTYSGLGPRLGIAGTTNLSHGFDFVSQLSGAILGGWTRPAEYSFAAVFDDVVNSEQIRSRIVSQVVWTGDAKLGLGYSRTLGNGSILKLESGYRAAVFINPFSTYETSTNVLPLDIGSLSTNSMRHTPSNFTLSGFYLTSSLQW